MSSKGTRVLIVILVILILVSGGIMAYKISQSKENETEEVSENQNEEILTAGIQQKEIQIFKNKE